LYASTDGKGAGLAFASGTATFFAGQATTLDLPLSGIMARFTVSLTPSTVTVGQTTPVLIVENAFDAAGERLAPGYVTTGLAKPKFSVNVTDAAGLSSGDYSGVGSGPITYTAKATGYPSATASLHFRAASPSTAGFALVNSGLGSPFPSVFVFPPDSTTPARTYNVPVYEEHPEEPRYDADGVLWLPTGGIRIGVKANGEWAGTLPLPGRLLTFDRSDKLYVSDPTLNAVDVYSGKTLVRQIVTPGSPYEAAVDPSGHVYVAILSSGLYEYGPNGNGDLTPIAVNATAATVGTDGAGNVYALYYPKPPNGGDYFGVWQAGTFSAKPPRKTYSPNVLPEDFGVDDAGAVYAAPSFDDPNTVFYAAAGSSSFADLPMPNSVYAIDAEIAVPIK